MKLTAQQRHQLFARLVDAMHREGVLQEAVAELPDETRNDIAAGLDRAAPDLRTFNHTSKYDEMTDEELEQEYLRKLKQHGLSHLA